MEEQEKSTLYTHLENSLPYLRIAYVENATFNGRSLYQENKRGIAISDGEVYTVIEDAEVSEEAMVKVVDTIRKLFEK